MARLFLWFSLSLVALSSAAVISNKGYEDVQAFEDTFGIEPHIFESQIVEALKKVREFVKNGDPSNGVPPMDPLFVPGQSFDFIINDTALEGSFDNVTLKEISNFEVEKVELKLIPLQFKVEILWQKVFIDGKYKMAGTIFDEIDVNGTGKFISETRNLSAYLYIRPISVDSVFQIKDLVLEFKVMNEKINYTNEYESDRVLVLDEKLALDIVDRAKTKYLPPLLQTGKLILNHFLLGYTFDQIWKMIMDIINQK